jgi:hypothetical protein
MSKAGSAIGGSLSKAANATAGNVTKAIGGGLKGLGNLISPGKK